jgi:hypothetical protein
LFPHPSLSPPLPSFSHSLISKWNIHNEDSADSNVGVSKKNRQRIFFPKK